MKSVREYKEQIFESIKHENEFGQEVWYARELQVTLGYKRWDKFTDVIHKAKEACEKSGNRSSDHFSHTGRMVDIGSGAQRKIEDVEMSRYACYLTVMNGDSKKEIVATGQTYFAVKTRQQELIEGYESLNEEQKRVAIRNEIREHNKSLADAAKQAGVIEAIDFAVFQNRGYQGLYGGLGVKEIHARKELKKSQKILDYMGSTELAANLFRATQAEDKLRREEVKGKRAAGDAHYEVGKKVRNTIVELGGTMPEELPTPEKSIKQIERQIVKKDMKSEGLR